MRKKMISLMMTVAMGTVMISGATVVKADSDEKETVKLAVWSSGAADNFQKGADEFNKRQDKINFVVEMQSGDYSQYLGAKVASNDLPDMFFLNPYAQVQQFAATDRIVDLSEEGFATKIYDSVKDACSYDGKIYAYPMAVEMLGVYYNQELFEKAGITEVPKTFSQMKEVCEKLQASGITPFAATYKEDESYKAEALEATHQLQMGNRGYRALWKHILQVSVTDLKKNYANLKVDFDLWNGESDVQDTIAPMVQKLKEQGLAYEDQGAVVVDVKEETDTKEVPPCMILKSDGAALYTTTDLATIVERMEKYNPDEIMYVVDKRQEMHFVQVFRCAKKAGMVKDDTKLTFLGFGTMNGKDGKPFKTREGGVMRLENLIRDINEEMYKKIVDNRSIKEEDARATAKIVGLSAIKYGDLSNQASKDYIFDIERFTSFEGNTGPYILYTTVRIKSILNRYKEEGGNLDTLKILAAGSDSEKALMLEASKFNQVITNAYEEKAPHKICSYIYELANAFNRFYHETKILAEEDQAKKESYLALLMLVKNILEACIDMLGFEAPERM